MNLVIAFISRYSNNIYMAVRSFTILLISLRGTIMKKLLLMTALIASSFTITTNASAEGDVLSLGIGAYDVFEDSTSFEGRAEWRSGKDMIVGIKPFIGAEGNTDGGILGLAGVYRDFPVAPQWYVTPSFGAGLFREGSGRDMDKTVQFRSQIEVQYELSSRNRIAASISNMSNDVIGGDKPDAQTVGLYYHMPWN
jgi:lipid A 3-O-deacylase